MKATIGRVGSEGPGEVHAVLIIQKGARVLAIGAHPDDIELGAGGFIYRLVREFEAVVTFLILTNGRQAPAHGAHYLEGVRLQEAREAAAHLCNNNNVQVIMADQFDDCTLDKHGHETIKVIEKELYEGITDELANRKPRYDIILSHVGEDTHADHRALYESTLSAARDFHGTLLLYQAPSTKPNGFHPTCFVRLDEEAIEKKAAALRMHISQRDKPFMTGSRTSGLAGSWPIFLRLPEGSYLEAFEVYKVFI
jgi:LmbE family N-acetylglucosaminyl deacetylase